MHYSVLKGQLLHTESSEGYLTSMDTDTSHSASPVGHSRLSNAIKGVLCGIQTLENDSDLHKSFKKPEGHRPLLPSDHSINKQVRTHYVFVNKDYHFIGKTSHLLFVTFHLPFLLT